MLLLLFVIYFYPAIKQARIEHMEKEKQQEKDEAKQAKINKEKVKQEKKNQAKQKKKVKRD